MNPWIIPGILNTIESIVASHYGVTVDDLRGRSRIRPIPEARFTAMYLMKTRYPMLHWREVGAIFNRDHSTAIHAKKFVEGQLAVDKNFQSKFQVIQSLIL